MLTGVTTEMEIANEEIISTEVAPFGGIKESGIDNFVEIKYLCMGGIR